MANKPGVAEVAKGRQGWPRVAQGWSRVAIDGWKLMAITVCDDGQQLGVAKVDQGGQRWLEINGHNCV